MNERIDLHTHTTYSDGSLTPQQLLERAYVNGVKTIAITDHDTVAAYNDPETQYHADRLGLELIPGIEISAVDQGHDVHIVGLFIDPESVAINGLISEQLTARREYTDQVAQLLIGDGWQLRMLDEVPEGTTVTKAHIADAVVGDAKNHARLAKQFGLVPTRGQFIEALMNDGGPYFVERHKTSTTAAIAAIREAGGISVLAHPVAYIQEGMKPEDLAGVIDRNDFDALEAVYYYYNKSRGDKFVNNVITYRKLARNHGLLVSGGSDYHGPSATVGNAIEVGIPDKFIGMAQSELEYLRSCAAKARL